MTIATAVASAEHEAGLVALFHAAGSPCFCRYWHFDGTNNEWLARCADAAEPNRAEFVDDLRAGADAARGVVALEGGEVVGWCKVAPAEAAPKIYDRRLYRRLPCFAGDRAGVFVVGCLLVHPRARRRGVAHALVGGAVRLAPGFGARALEAFPRVPNGPVSDEELFTGPRAVFLEHGFEVVNDFAPYPVLRRALP